MLSIFASRKLWFVMMIAQNECRITECSKTGRNVNLAIFGFPPPPRIRRRRLNTITSQVNILVPSKGRVKRALGRTIEYAVTCGSTARL
uniref:Putative secreted protein n=1 Tax=Anopheles darlingi TaxID=43151 RepID=A0A2M4DEU2_ANODA